VNDKQVKKKVLFICTHNSARSQIAEGMLNSLFGNKYQAYSAGTEPSVVNPHAIQVMAEIGIDLSKHRSKNINEFVGQKLDFVVTVCDRARETCPYFPGGIKRLHRSFEDPASFKGTEAERLSAFRRIRDEIRGWIEKVFGIDR
jgi:arsenate reductase